MNDHKKKDTLQNVSSSFRNCCHGSMNISNSHIDCYNPSSHCRTSHRWNLEIGDNKYSFLAEQAALEAPYTLEMEIVYKFELQLARTYSSSSLAYSYQNNERKSELLHLIVDSL